jgi:hypothetical protein
VLLVTGLHCATLAAAELTQRWDGGMELTLAADSACQPCGSADAYYQTTGIETYSMFD